MEMCLNYREKDLFTLSDISCYSDINIDTLKSRIKTLGITPVGKVSMSFLYTRSQAGCIIGNYTYKENNDFVILESKLNYEK